MGSTVLQRFVEEALLNQRDNPRTRRIEPRQSPHTILPPPTPADGEGESSMGAQSGSLLNLNVEPQLSSDANHDTYL